MASGITLTNFESALKQIYRDSNVENLTLDRNPLFGLVKKFEGFGGRNMPIVLQYGNPQSRSATFSVAQTLSTTSTAAVSLEDFLLTRVSDHHIATISNEAIEATAGDAMAFLKAIKSKIDGSMKALSSSLEEKLYRSGAGEKCKVNDTTAPTAAAAACVITLDYKQSAALFEVGMSLVCSVGVAGGGGIGNVPAGAALRTTPASAKITAVNRSGGTITTDFVAGSTNWAVSDFLFQEGDALVTGGVVVGTNCVSGLADWIPDTDTQPTVPALFGVTRSVDSRLYGQYYDGSALPMEDLAIDAQGMAAQEQGSPDIFLIHNVQYRRLIKELGAKKIYTQIMAQNAKGEAQVGYRAVMIEGDVGPINVVASNKCQVRRGWMLTKDSFTFNSLGKAPKVSNNDKNEMLRQASDDGVESRLVYRGNLSCTAPIWNVQVLLPTP
jgi:hypothetical protein